MGYPPFMETRTWLCLKMLKKHLFFPFFSPSRWPLNRENASELGVPYFQTNENMYIETMGFSNGTIQQL